MTEQILAAARSACATNPWPDFPDPGKKNAANVALLIGLLDSAQTVARAVFDNAMDDRNPISKQLANELYAQSWNIGRIIVDSSQVLEVAP